LIDDGQQFGEPQKGHENAYVSACKHNSAQIPNGRD
jgi:hypothetical protein